MASRIPTNRSVAGQTPSGTNTYIGAKETYLDRNAKLIPSDETTTALTNMNWIAGHHTVDKLENLYNIPDFILSQETYADQISSKGEDAIGQLWYVESEKCLYMLINWANRRSANGWSKTNIKSILDPSGASSTQYLNKDKVYDNITSVTMEGDGTISYVGWTQDIRYSYDKTKVWMSYTHANNSTSATYINTLNAEYSGNDEDGTTVKDGAGVMTSAQYAKILARLRKLEKECIWKSSLANNGATYLWSGTLTQFNALTEKPTNTTFIITN